MGSVGVVVLGQRPGGVQGSRRHFTAETQRSERKRGERQIRESAEGAETTRSVAARDLQKIGLLAVFLFETKGGGVDAVALAGGFRAVGEDVAEVGVAF